VSLFNSHYHESAASGDEIRAPSRVALTFFRARLKISLLAATVTALIKHQSRRALARPFRGKINPTITRRVSSTPVASFSRPPINPRAQGLHVSCIFRLASSLSACTYMLHAVARRIRTRLPEFAQSRSEGSGRSGTRLYYTIATEGGFRKEGERHRYDVRSVSPIHTHTYTDYHFARHQHARFDEKVP